MFWRFGGYASISSIDTLLDKPDVSLEELLDESELIQELKQHNTKLIEYLRDDNVLKRLMDHVTAPSLVNDDDEDDVNDTNGSKDATTEEEKRGDPLKDILDPEDLERAEKERLKRAYVACEILSAEVWSILDSIMLNPDHLRDFWGFLRRSPSLDSLQASYFTKVNETLFDRKTSEMLDFLKSLDGIIPAILQHIDNPMVMDLLLKIISLEKVEGGQGIVDNDQTCIGPNSLTRQLVSRPCVESLIKAMLQGGNPLTVGVGIVIEVIRKNNSDYDPDTINSPDSLPTTYDPIYLGNLLRIFAKHIPDFMKLIQSSKHTVKDGEKLKSVDRGKLSSAWGAKIEPLGFDRFKTCELMAELLHCSNMALLNQPGSEEYVQQRDAERERLLREGAFNANTEETSAFDGNDSTVDFVNGSMVAYRSPEDSKVLEVANTGEDGFEDVSSSGVLADKEKDTAEAKDTTGQETQSQSIPSSELQGSTPTKEQGSSVPIRENEDQKEATNDGTTHSPSSDPMSPSALGITDRVREVTLDTNRNADDNRLATEAVPKESSVTLRNDSEQETVPTSSTSESVPPPLFASNQENQLSSSHNPDAAGQAGDASSSTRPAAEVQTTEDEPRQHMHPDIQLDPNGQPVVGDYLKLMFVENRVVPTILGFFFRFPWNNFLHNVVYDVIQQVFNGPMERGYNRVLAVDVFETGRITQEIVEGQKRSDETQRTKQIRLGYMGHLTLIAEEVVKFSERHPPELLSPTVMENVLNPEWIDYVEQTLSETRERDNAILGGVRPDMSIGHRQGMLNSGQSMTGSSALADAGLNGAAGGSTFQGFDMMSQGSVSGGAFGLNGGGSSLLSGFASSSDDEDEDMEDQDDRNLADQSAEGGSENASANSTSQPIPILPPPPAPLSLGPSRARRQLAARLAAQKQQAAEGTGENGEKGEEKAQTNAHENSQWPANPFVVAGVDDDGDGGGSPSNAFPSTDFPSANKDEPFSSPTFPDSGFSPPDSFSTNSSEDDVEGRSEGLRRKERIPLEVDDDDDDDMGEMVGPSGGADMMDSDEEDEAIMNESLGYPDLGPGRYKSFRRSRFGVSPFGDDDQNDSSDGEDDGLVEILVPGRKS
ncbi:hypothetical protein APSETT444_001461 [Aspergillus pseudonomiae]